MQITRLLFESEAKRAEKMKEQQADAAPMVGKAGRPGAVPGVLKGEEGYSSIPQTEESYVRVSMATFGGTADYWRDQFRKQGG